MNIETKDNGERDSKPGICLYCGAIKGTHTAECHVPQRTVVLEITIRYVASVPRVWDQSAIEFHRNDSSFCLSNDLMQICREDDCTCGRSKVAFIREATEQDHEDLFWKQEDQ